ncbi:MAG: hypothetical protein EPO21_23720 [Chloroflexota bacterium]|nr:MAG: hypothetical protein EPO21_23720 [Chloroflexota bacterium]
MDSGGQLAGLPVVFLGGGPREIGERHGRLLREEIGALREELHTHVFGVRGRLFGAVFRRASLFLARRMQCHLPLSTRVEMEALALAARVPLDDILLLNCFDDLVNLLRIFAPGLGGVLCSSFVLLSSRTADGHLLHGRNLDYYFPPGLLSDGGHITKVLRRSQVLFAYEPRNGYAFVSIGWPGYIGALTAVNERHLTLSSLTSYLPGGAARGEPTGILYRRIMQEASDLREAEQLLRQARRTIGNNLLVASGEEEDARLFQLAPGKIIVATPVDGRLVCTNHFLDPELRRRQSHVIQPHSLTRAARLSELCRRAAVDPATAQSFLADIARPSQAADEYAAVANPGTLQSVVFSPAEERLWIAIGQTPPVSLAGFERVELSELLHPGRAEAG